MKATELIKVLEVMVMFNGDKEVCILADEFLMYHKVRGVRVQRGGKNQVCKSKTKFPFFSIE